MARFVKNVNGVDYELVQHTCPCCGETMQCYVLPETAEELRVKPAVLCDIPPALKQRISTGLCSECHNAVLHDALFISDEENARQYSDVHECADELVCV